MCQVCHPHVAARIHTDFRLLRRLAAAASRLRALRFLRLQQTVDQFSHTMTAQADLRVEAMHLHRFHANFRAAAPQVGRGVKGQGSGPRRPRWVWGSGVGVQGRGALGGWGGSGVRGRRGPRWVQGPGFRV